MLSLPHSEKLVRESLAYLLDVLKVEDDFTKPIKARRHSLGLGSGDQLAD
jgi:hypothetical protein